MSIKPLAVASVVVAIIASIGPTAVPAAGAQDTPEQPGFVRSEFIYESAPFPQCHASTIVETRDGLVAAWFGGTREKHPDVGIWVSRHDEGKWTAPIEVANGATAERRHPCWNPVLFQPEGGPLVLFYKVGPSPSGWWGMVGMSQDAGRTWEKGRRLPEGMVGPIKNKPVALGAGVALCPSSSENDGWRAHFERVSDRGNTWTTSGPVDDGHGYGAIQPTILIHPNGRLQALCRSRQGKRITQTFSDDGGRTWSELAATDLPNPNSGIDGVTLRDGRHLLVYNHTVRGGPFPQGREMLNVAVSGDGKHWKAALVLERQRGEYSYPAVIQTSDGLVHVTYTYQRKRVKHTVIDPAQLELSALPDAAD